MQRIIQSSLKLIRPSLVQSTSASVVLKRSMSCTSPVSPHYVWKEQQRRSLSHKLRNYNSTGQPMPLYDIDPDRLVNVKVDDGMCLLSWDDGHSSKYPYVWLRDNCQCAKCYHPSSYQRQVKMIDLDPDGKAKDEEVSRDGSNLKITWPDNHVSEYPSTWLRKHQFNKTTFDPIAHIVPKAWSTELNGSVPTFKYHDVITKDEGLFDWLSELYKTGLTVLTGAPKKIGAVELIGKRVAYMRENVFGRLFEVYAKFEPKNSANTSDDLELHVDLASYNYVPGIQILHCITQTKLNGGDNVFSDGYQTWLEMKEENPEIYKLLTTIDIHHRNCASDGMKDIHTIKGRPVFDLDLHGNFKAVNYNSVARAPYLDTSVDNVQNVYRAFKIFMDKSKKNAVHFKLKEGEIVIFNNIRVMHGRKGYEMGSDNNQSVRYLEGGYLDWDEVHSRMRVLYERRHGVLGL